MIELRIILLLIWMTVLFSTESIIPFRQYQESRLQHITRNIVLVGVNFVFNFFLAYLVLSAADLAASNQWGLFHTIEVPTYIRALALFLIYDVVLYWWHLANHEVKWLWNFHRMHHSDRAMDFTTATRFHIVELGLFVGVRALLTLALGATFTEMVILETIVIVCSQFNHSNIYLPDWLDDALSTILVTPKMHRTHHSQVKKERNANYTTVLSIWDKLFKSYVYQSHDDQKDVIIGLRKYPHQSKITLKTLLLIPFKK